MTYEVIEELVYSRLKADLMASEISPLLKPTSVTTEPANAVTIFPSIYIHELQPVELGRDLEGIDINCELVSIEINVTVDTDKMTAKRIAWECVDKMKRMGFEAFALPLYAKSSNIHTYSMRFRRNFSENDVF